MLVYYHMLLIGIASVLTILSFYSKINAFYSYEGEGDKSTGKNKRLETAEISYPSNPFYPIIAMVLWVTCAVTVADLEIVFAQYDVAWQTLTVHYYEMYYLSTLFYGLALASFVMSLYAIFIFIKGMLKKV